MGKHREYHFYLKDKNSIIPTPINFAVNKGTFRRKIAVGLSILPEWWDPQKEQAIVDNRQTRASKSLSKKVNRQLNRLRVDLDELFDQYVDADSLSPKDTDGDEILEELFSKAKQIIEGAIVDEEEEKRKSRIKPIQFFTNFIENWSRTPNKRTGLVPDNGTIYNYKNTLRRYSDYVEECLDGRDSFSIFVEDFQDDFDRYLMEEQDLSMNTIASTHSQLKTMLRSAYQKGLLKDSSFQQWISKPVTMYHVYLNDDELKKIYSLTLTEKLRSECKIGQQSKIEDTKNLFIISARTGLRYSDLRHLNDAEWEIDDEEKRYFITTTIQKTKDRISIPLHREVVAIYKSYDGRLPMPVNKSHYNEQIRSCAKFAGITTPTPCFKWENGKKKLDEKEKWELVSSHTGRRSFATNLYLQTKSASYVMSLTGHSTEENFRRYICVEQREMAELVAKYINLDVEGENQYLTKEALDSIRHDALTMAEQTSRIISLEKSLRSQRLMNSISEDEIKSKEAEIARLKQFWGFGYSPEEYAAIMRDADDRAQEAESAESPESLAKDAQDYYNQLKN